MRAITKPVVILSALFLLSGVESLQQNTKGGFQLEKRVLDSHISGDAEGSEEYDHGSEDPEVPPKEDEVEVPSGKGKGKGQSSYSGKGDVTESPKASASKSSKKSSSGKGKGKGDSTRSPVGGKGSRKSSKKSSSGDTYAPSAPGAPSAPSPGSGTGPSDDNSRPPSPVPPGPPSSTPNPDASPTLAPEDVTCYTLSPYAIAYTLGDNAMPMRNDYMEVASITDAAVRAYMEEYSPPTNVASVDTILVTTTFRFGQPAIMTYESVACFPNDGPQPTVEELDTILGGSLTPPDEYIELLTDLLGEANAFSTTTDAVFTDVDEEQISPTEPTEPESSTSSNAAAIAASAVGFTLLVAGVVLYKRRAGEDDDQYDQKLYNKNLHGDATIDGETYAGLTCDGTVSVAPSMGLSRDEEKGMVNVDLKNIDEEDASSSVAPVWDGDFVAGHDAYKQTKDSQDSDESESLLAAARSISQDSEESQFISAPARSISQDSEESRSLMEGGRPRDEDEDVLRSIPEYNVQTVEEYDAGITDLDAKLSDEETSQNSTSTEEGASNAEGEEAATKHLSVEEIETLLETL